MVLRFLFILFDLWFIVMLVGYKRRYINSNCSL